MKSFKAIATLLFLSVFMFLACNGEPEASGPEKIVVLGNKFVTASGEEVVFRGLNIKDPHDLDREGHFTKDHFEEAVSWGANVIRLPIHPMAWRDRGQEAYLALIDSAIVWARDLDVHLILDWHSIGNLYAEKFQSKNYNTSMEETLEFWDIVAKRYADEPVVAMYELYNEPTVGGERFGEMSWGQWKVMNLEMISVIRKYTEDAVILVAGFNWAYDLVPIKDDPIDLPGIAYVSHPYPQKREQPWEPKWEEDWGFVAEKYPVILTEVGYALPEEKGVHVPVYGDEVYGNALVNYTKERGISWVAWCFDPRWSPCMFTDWDYTPTSQGAFFKEVMLGD